MQSLNRYNCLLKTAVQFYKNSSNEHIQYFVTSSYYYKIVIAVKSDDYTGALKICKDGLAHTSGPNKDFIQTMTNFIKQKVEQK
jgi:hypothetical protein